MNGKDSPLEHLKEPQEKRESRARAWSEKIGLKSQASRYSGGEGDGGISKNGRSLEIRFDPQPHRLGMHFYRCDIFKPNRSTALSEWRKNYAT